MEVIKLRSYADKTYSREEKIKIVEEYLDGNGSLRSISYKYGIPSKETLRKWDKIKNWLFVKLCSCKISII